MSIEELGREGERERPPVTHFLILPKQFHQLGTKYSKMSLQGVELGHKRRESFSFKLPC